MKTWTIDTAHSEIAFKVKHLMISTVRGTFRNFEGTIATADDTFENAQITFSADVGSIDTKNEHRDAHLQAADLFDAGQFPKISFVSTSVTKTSEGFDVAGDFTMKGVTKQVHLKAAFNGIAKGPMDGIRVAAFDVTGSLNRQDFGVSWNAALEAGGVAVSDTVLLEATIEAKEA